MKVKCPGCDNSFDILREQLIEGVKIQCPQCGRQFLARIKKGAEETSSPSFLSEPEFGALKSPGSPRTSPTTFLPSKEEEDLFGGSMDLFGGKEKKEGEKFGSLFEDSDPFASPPSVKPPPPAQPKGSSSPLASLFEESDPREASPLPKSSKPPQVPNFDWDEAPGGGLGSASPPRTRETRSSPPPASTGSSPAPSPLPKVGGSRFTSALKEADLERIVSSTVVKPQEKPSRSWLRPVLYILLLATGGGALLATRSSWMSLLTRFFGKEHILEEASLVPFIPEGAFVVQRVRHRLGYEAIVVTGRMRNMDTVSQSFLKLKVVLKGEKGEPVAESMVYAGNVLSEAELTTLPQSRINEILATETGKALANFNIPPQGTVEFMAVFFRLPPGEFTAEVFPISSQKGAR